VNAPAVRISGAVKRYGDVTAVNGLDLDVAPGTFLGLLGPNGAGKSTTMRMLTGQTRADSGEVEVLGCPLPGESRRARALTGVVPQHDNLDTELTVRQNLDVFARFAQIPRARRRAVVDRALGATRLLDRADHTTDGLSGGMRRRLLLARGIINDPRLLLLDEPTVGLDPQVRQEMWDVIGDMRSAGTTVVMSTHYIEEAERLADEVAVVFAGRVVTRGAPAALLREHAGRQAAEFEGTPQRRSEVEALAARAGLPSRRTGLSVSVLRAETMPADVRDLLGPPDVLRRTTLEDVFVLLTGELFL
jgi:lipooligosaccharide transport system ATP-binding protein